MDPAERRIVVSLTHALHTGVAVLLAYSLVRAWQEHSMLACVVGVVLGATYLRSRSRPWLVVTLLLWAVGSGLSLGFAWLAFPLYFLALHGFPGRWRFAVLAAMAGWSAWCTASVGPVVGAAVAVLASVLFTTQRRDALAHRALVAQLREEQAARAAAEHERGVIAERERLAREIHDTVGQGLASIVLLTRGGAANLPLIEETARENLAQARAFVRALGTPGEVGLVEGLHPLVADARTRSAAEGHPVDVTLTVEGTPRALDPQVVAALHRGVQTGLANVLRHAEARSCRVSVTWFEGQVVVDVIDDGRGFTLDTPGPDSYGLTGLRRRLEEIGGILGIESEPGRTALALTVPLTQESR